MKVFPIKSAYLISKMSECIRENFNFKTYALWLFGLNTGLRVSDILSLKWQDDLLDEDGNIREQLFHKDKKTKKIHTVYLCRKLAITMAAARKVYPDDIYVFQSEAVAFGGIGSSPRSFKSCESRIRPYTRQYVFNVLKVAADYAGVNVNVGAHTMRKTFAHAQYMMGVDINLIGEILQHSTPEITKRYICLEEDDQREVYLQSNLGFPDEMDEIVLKNNLSHRHLQEVSTMMHQIVDLPEEKQRSALEHLLAIYNLLWVDPKHRRNYAQRIILAALYLEKRLRS